MELKEKKISIIIPIFNGEHFVQRCIESILAQQYKNIEVILVDDGSTDQTLLCCKKMMKKSNKVKVIHTLNQGVSSARNYALSCATGEYITFCDIDDYVEKDIYQKMVNILEETDSDMVICGRYDVLNGQKKKIVYDQNFIWSSQEACIRCIEDPKIMGSVWNKLFRKEIVESVNFDETLEYCEDMYYLARIFNKNKNMKVAYINQALYNYVQTGQNKTKMENKFFDESGKLKYNVSMYKIIELFKNNRRILLAARSRTFLFAYEALKMEGLSPKNIKYLKNDIISNMVSYFVNRNISILDKCKKVIKIPIYMVKF